MIEINMLPGSGKLRISGSLERQMRDSFQRAFDYLKSVKIQVGVGSEMDIHDFSVEAVDLLGTGISAPSGIALFVALLSALKKQSVLPASVVLGDMTVQGNLKALPSLSEPLQVGLDNGARKAIIPIENKRHFFDVAAEIVETVDPIFYKDPIAAAMKALGIV